MPLLVVLVLWIFFFQAEDGIRDLTVTGVQTCALPISVEKLDRVRDRHQRGPVSRRDGRARRGPRRDRGHLHQHRGAPDGPAVPHVPVGRVGGRVPRLPAVQLPPRSRQDLPRRRRSHVHRLHAGRPRGDGGVGRPELTHRAADAGAHPRRAALRHRLRRDRPRRDRQGAHVAGVARLHRPRSHPSPLRGAGAHQEAERAADLLPGVDARPLGPPAEGRDPSRGSAHPGSGRVRPGDRGRPGGRRPVATAGVRTIGGRLTGRLRAVLHLDDAPSRIALALAVGVFISCTPFYGLQTLLSLGIATLFRLNKVATITGTWLNLPWFAPLVYGRALHIRELIVPDPQG